MSRKLLQQAFLAAVVLALTACFQVELGGPVAGASVQIVDLRSGALIQDDVNSESEQSFIESKNQKKWDKLGDIGRLVVLGNFFVDGALFKNNRLYLVTVSDGVDIDGNSDLVVDDSPTRVKGKVHAILSGAQLKAGGTMVSLLTEAVYQAVKADLPQLSDGQLIARLDALASTMLTDINDDEAGLVDYADLVAWTVLFHKDNYQLDYGNVEALRQLITDGASIAQIEKAAQAVLGEQPLDAQQFFTDKVSNQVVQAKCITCHQAGGVAAAAGARLVFVGSNRANYLSLNHQQFVALGEKVNDLTSYVTEKAQGQRGHGGGRQLSPGTALNNLTEYLGLID